MDLLVVVLRLIHIFGAVFWAGGSFMLVSFIEPTAIKTEAAGQKIYAASWVENQPQSGDGRVRGF